MLVLEFLRQKPQALISAFLAVMTETWDAARVVALSKSRGVHKEIQSEEPWWCPSGDGPLCPI